MGEGEGNGGGEGIYVKSDVRFHNGQPVWWKKDGVCFIYFRLPYRVHLSEVSSHTQMFIEGELICWAYTDVSASVLPTHARQLLA